MWRNQRIEELVTRIELQSGSRIGKKRVASCTKLKGKRAKHLVKEGARARAVMSLTSELADLDPEEEIRYAEELLPQSVRPARALSTRSSTDVTAEETELGSNIKGIRFKALSAPGPSGARPEHLKEMLACRNKCAGRELARSLREFVVAVSQG